MFIQTKCPLLLQIVLVCTVTLISACNQQSYSSPDGYDLTKPQKMELGKVLNEISGLTYYQENNALLAISDSKEKVFELEVEKRKLKDFTDKVVGPQNDLEDLVRVDSIVYLLSSRGKIYAVPMKGKRDSSDIKSYELSSDEKNDFETLYYDPTVKGLVMLCKTCASDKSDDIHSAYRFDLATRSFDSTSLYTIDDAEVKKIL